MPPLGHFTAQGRRRDGRDVRPVAVDVHQQLTRIGIRNFQDAVPTINAALLPRVPRFIRTQQAHLCVKRGTALWCGLPAEMPQEEVKCPSSLPGRPPDRS